MVRESRVIPSHLLLLRRFHRHHFTGSGIVPSPNSATSCFDTSPHPSPNNCFALIHLQNARQQLVSFDTSLTPRGYPLYTTNPHAHPTGYYRITPNSMTQPPKTQTPAATDALPSRSKKLKSAWKALPDVWALIHPRRGLLILGLGLMAINRLSGLILPASTKYLVDDVIGKRQTHLLTPIVLAVG